MKVKELIKYLCDFNPEAEVMYLEDGEDFPVNVYGWKCVGDDDGYGKLNAVSISLVSDRHYNVENKN